MSQTQQAQAQNINSYVQCEICNVRGHISRNCQSSRAVEIIREFYCLFAINECIYENSPVDFTIYKNYIVSNLEAMRHCLEYKRRFKKCELEFLYYFFECIENEYQINPQLTKKRFVNSIITKFEQTKHQDRSFNYKEGAQVCVQYFSYDRTKQSMADQFDNILGSNPLSPLFKKLIKIPLDITKDTRDLARRQETETAIRRIISHLPEDAVREILNVPQTPVQNVRPQQQAPPPPPRPSQAQPSPPPRPQQPVSHSKIINLVLKPLSDDILPKTQTECSICLSDIEKDNMCFLECNHFFHLDCLVEMCSSKTACSSKCPMCRIPLKKTFVSKNAFVNYFVKTNMAAQIIL